MNEYKLNLYGERHAGKLVVFEGTDGAGKTTLLTLARNYLESMYGSDRLLCVKQPTDLSRNTRLFQKMMYCPQHQEINYRAVQLLTMSDRVQHDHEVIVPALRAGKVVLCDRYVYTSLANMLSRGYRKEKWFYESVRHIIRPDVSFLAYCPPEQAIKRIRERPEESSRYLNENLLKNVSKEFLKVAEANGLTVLDTDKTSGETFAQLCGLLPQLGGQMKNANTRT